MPAYVIGVNEETTDAAKWAAYLAAAAKSFPKGVKPLVKFGKCVAPESDDIVGVAVFEFDSFKSALSWYESDAYQAAIAERVGASNFKVYIVEGLTD